MKHKNIFYFIIVFLLVAFLSWRFIITPQLIMYATDIPVNSEEFEANFYSTLETIEARDGYFDIDYDIISWQGLIPHLNVDVLPIGELVIPSIDLQLPILHSVLYEHMHLGAVAMSPDQMQLMSAGVGNYVLTSNPESHSNTLLGDIYLLEVGDYIYIRDELYVYVYRTILESEIIGEYRSDVVDEVPNMTVITLLTAYENGHDLIMVQGEFVEQIPISSYGTENEALSDELSSVIYKMTEGRPSIAFPWLQIIGTIITAIIVALGALLFVNKESAERLNKN